LIGIHGWRWEATDFKRAPSGGQIRTPKVDMLFNTEFLRKFTFESLLLKVYLCKFTSVEFRHVDFTYRLYFSCPLSTFIFSKPTTYNWRSSWFVLDLYFLTFVPPFPVDLSISSSPPNLLLTRPFEMTRKEFQPDGKANKSSDPSDGRFGLFMNLPNELKYAIASKVPYKVCHNKPPYSDRCN
jgi:hypothetical protein